MVSADQALQSSDRHPTKPSQFRFALVGLWAAFSWPVLHLTSHNYEELQRFGIDGITQIAAMCGAGAICATSTAIIAARISPKNATYLVTVLTVTSLLFFFFSFVYGTIAETLTRLGFTHGAGIGFIALTVAIYAVLWRMRHLPQIAMAIAVFVCVAALVPILTLILQGSLPIAAKQIEPRIDLQRTGQAKAHFSSTRLPVIATNQFTKNNVFYIIVDGYTGDRSLKTIVNLDIRAFVTNMEERGFVYVKESRSNYTGSAMSIGSIFHLDYFQDAKRPHLPNNPRDYFPIVMGRDPLPALLDIFKNQGYALYFSESWYSGCNSSTVRCVFQTSVFDLNQVSQLVLTRTPLKKFVPSLFYLHVDAMAPIDDRFLGDLVTRDKPAFIFAHHMQPHSPYYFDRNCDPIYADDKANRMLYREAVLCTNKRITELVSRILAADSNAIIVIHADHGSGFLGNEQYADRKEHELPKHALDERTETISFIRAPKECRQWIKPNLGPINTARFVLGCLSRTKPDYLLERVLVPKVTSGGAETLVEYDGFRVDIPVTTGDRMAP